MTGTKLHFSVDDVLDALLESSAPGGNPETQPFLRYLDELHAEFGVYADLYLFLEKDGAAQSLREVSAKLRPYFAARPWIRFGPHALKNSVAPHNQTVEEQRRTFEDIYAAIAAFASPGQLSRFVRLHYFSEAYEHAELFSARGVEGLFLTDKDAIAYRLPEPLKNTIRAEGSAMHNGLRFLRSHLRVERVLADGVQVDALSALVKSHSERAHVLSVFTHEYELLRPEVREFTRHVPRAARAGGAIPV